MKRFLAVYTGAADARKRAHWEALPGQERQALIDAGLKAWTDWGIRHAHAIVEQGGPLGKTKRASNSGIEDIRNLLTGYVIVEAESHEAAAKMFEGHPHFTIFPGESVEIMECLPLPGSSGTS